MRLILIFAALAMAAFGQPYRYGINIYSGQRDIAGDPNWQVRGVGAAASRPATCTARRDVYVCIGAGCTTGKNLHYCTATNTWTEQGSDVAGSGTVTNTGGDLTADAPVFGAGGVDSKVGTKSGNTNNVVTSTVGNKTTGKVPQWDANDNLTDGLTIGSNLNVGTFAAMGASSPAAGDLWVVTDAQSPGRCDLGGGTSRSICVYDGAAWAVSSGMVAGGSSGQIPFQVGTGVTGFSASLVYSDISKLLGTDGGFTAGKAGTATGQYVIHGTTSGSVTLTAGDVAGTWTFQLPTSGGSSGQVLQTNGSGVSSWVTRLADSGGNGILTRTALGVTGVAASSDVIALWSGTCNSGSFLRGDGACAAPAGAGDVLGASNLTTAGRMVSVSAAGTVTEQADVSVAAGVVTATGFSGPLTGTARTSATSFQVDSGSNGPRIKNNAGTLEVRNAADDAYAPLKASQIEAGDGTADSALILPEKAANGTNDFRIYGRDAMAADGCIVVDGQPANDQILRGTLTTSTIDGKTCRLMAWEDMPAGTGDVTAASNLTDNVVVVGDGGAKGVKSMPVQVANRVYAGPATGADAAPTFRALVAADLPATYQPLDAALTALAGGSDFVRFTGPTTTIKEFTLPDGGAFLVNTAGTLTNGQLVAGGGNAVVSAVNLSGDVTTSGSTATTLGSNFKVSSFGITIDGGGSAITTGVKGYAIVPYACTIAAWSLVADQSGSIVVDIWKRAGTDDAVPTVAHTITAAAKPTLSTDQIVVNNSTLTGWTTSVSANDVIGFNVDSATTVQRVTLTVKCTR